MKERIFVKIKIHDRRINSVFKHGFFPSINTVIRISIMDDEIKLIVSNEANVSLDEVTDNSTLLGDLKVDGDDAWEIFEQCHDKFKLDLTDFHFNKYFRCEPCFKGFIYLYRKIKYRDEHIAAKKIPITVRQLIAACKNGKW